MRLESTKFTIKRKDSKSKRESCTQSARPGASVNYYMKLKASTGSLRPLADSSLAGCGKHLPLPVAYY